MFKFQVEPADHSVGIMSEDFSGYLDDGKAWCRVADYGATLETTKFEWYDNETGDPCTPPENAKKVEADLHAAMLKWYEDQDYGDPE